ncbi:MAG: polyprenyl diphosphate synthase [Treponema sp.]|nr:polyprenyl diphosphate synthase [Treponema sp.]
MSRQNDNNLNGNELRHIGIIMDGNGRWAQRRGLFRTQGHLEGLKAAKRVVKAASDLGISYLTLYTFSTENWARAADEVGFILGLVKQYLRGELEFYRENRIRIRHAGNRDGLPGDILEELDEACRDTSTFEGLQVILALNYGGRDEILRAVNKFIANDAARNDGNITGASSTAGPLTEEKIRGYLDNPDVPDPDLIIRTAGEFRISNFLLWEGAYAEYYISDKFWPDWTKEDLEQAIESYGKRDRRFGAVNAGNKN